jgi:DNA replication protein DnaC
LDKFFELFSVSAGRVLYYQHGMANLKHLTKLFEAISKRNWNTAETVALTLAEEEERIGHHSAAQRLRGAIRPNGHTVGQYLQGEVGTYTVNDSAFFLTSALSQIPAERDLSSMRLKPSNRKQLEEIVKEWRFRDELTKRGLLRRTKLLFHGPPGCGKSMTARAIGREMGLPVYVVRFDAVVGAYLGQTALHLRQLFQFAETTPSVLLIDEIDALGKRRGSPLDVGELDRVVIALLQELEHSRPVGLVIATSNLASQLDDALWRRFDLVVEFPTPSRKDLESFINALAKERNITLRTASINGAKNYGDAERLVQEEERRLVLEGR